MPTGAIHLEENISHLPRTPQTFPFDPEKLLFATFFFFITKLLSLGNLSPPSSFFPVFPSSHVLLWFGEISAGNCESFTSCSHNGLWDYAKHSGSAALHIDLHQRRPLEDSGTKWRILNEDVNAITQTQLIAPSSVCSSLFQIPSFAPPKKTPLSSKASSFGAPLECMHIFN